jgi:hypothetical protein
MVMNKRIKRLLVLFMIACAPDMAVAQRPEIPSNVVKLDAGVSFITSKVYVYNLGDSRFHKFTWKPGFSGKIDYEHFWQSGWGIGVNVIYHNTNFDAGYGAIGYSQGYYEYQFNQWYFGPCAAYRFRFGDSKWTGDVSIGMGYSRFSENLDDKIIVYYGGLGVSWRAGIEYMLSPDIGLGLDLTDLMAFVSQPDYSSELKTLGMNEFDGANGFFRLSLMAGLRIYF